MGEGARRPFQLKTVSPADSEVEKSRALERD